MIGDTEVEKALDFLRDSAVEIAKARADMLYADEYRKTLKAILMKENADMPVNAQEREAYAHDRYLQHLSEIRDAVFNFEKLRATREAASMKIEAWRSQSATLRANKI